MKTHKKYFLQRVWYFSARTRSPPRSLDLHFNQGFINVQNVGIGIVVKVCENSYIIVPEWNRLTMGERDYKSSQANYVSASKVFCGIDVDLSELLTHPHEFVRKVVAKHFKSE